MNSVCISTVVSGDGYEFYIPMFIYAAKVAYPEYYVKVFICGELIEPVKILLDRMREEKFCDPNWEVKENLYTDIKKRKGTINALRFLVPEAEFKDFKYLYITDIDFLLFRQKPTLEQWYKKILSASKQTYVAARGPKYRPHRRRINKGGWRRKFKRLACGRVFFLVPEWFERTRKVRAKYLRLAREGGHDAWDKHEFGRYREYDEVMLNRICLDSKIPTPKGVAKTLTGHAIGSLYRDIHLGDFKFRKRGHSMKKLTKKIRASNLKSFIWLQKTPGWKKIETVVQSEHGIRVCLRRLRKHIKERMK
jgi:hypothetical protein